jgi:hypothetical protein
MSAESTGPNSRTNETETNPPVNPTAPKRESSLEVCSVSTAPVKKPVSMTTVSDPTPIKSI